MDHSDPIIITVPDGTRCGSISSASAAAGDAVLVLICAVGALALALSSGHVQWAKVLTDDARHMIVLCCSLVGGFAGALYVWRRADRFSTGRSGWQALTTAAIGLSVLLTATVLPSVMLGVSL